LDRIYQQRLRYDYGRPSWTRQGAAQRRPTMAATRCARGERSRPPLSHAHPRIHAVREPASREVRRRARFLSVVPGHAAQTFVRDGDAQFNL